LFKIIVGQGLKSRNVGRDRKTAVTQSKRGVSLYTVHSWMMARDPRLAINDVGAGSLAVQLAAAQQNKAKDETPAEKPKAAYRATPFGAGGRSLLHEFNSRIRNRVIPFEITMPPLYKDF
jgi:hypothetical protein